VSTSGKQELEEKYTKGTKGEGGRQYQKQSSEKKGVGDGANGKGRKSGARPKAAKGRGGLKGVKRREKKKGINYVSGLPRKQKRGKIESGTGGRKKGQKAQEKTMASKKIMPNKM